jgi:two-component system osmolarity sensor histidine kinase EnvZ
MSLSPTERIGALIWPPRLAGRISRLLAVGLLLLLAICLAALRHLSLQPGSDQMADLLAAHVVALRAVSGTARDTAGLREGTALLEVVHAAQPPQAATVPLLPFARRLVERLEQQLGDGSKVLIEDAERSWLWVGPTQPGDAWLAVALPPFRQQATALSLVVVGIALAMVLLGGMLLARMLTRPLQRLADQAPALAAGELDVSPVDDSAPEEVRELAGSLLRAAADTRERSRQRELMLAGLSHDLRTPLARLRYAIALSPATEAALQAQMEADLEELDALVGLFLDLGRGGRLRESFVDIDLAVFINTLLERNSDHHWEYRIPEWLRLRAPPLALARLLGNLIRNAERHGAAPFSLLAGEDAEGIWIEVADQGPGIASRDRARLVRPFERGSEHAEGSGLGLAIASQLSEAMGAQLRLEDAEPQGLRARVRGLQCGQQRR